LPLEHPVDAQTGSTYPCGYRGKENLGKFWDLDISSRDPNQVCLGCDWECFRDPSELFGPILQGIRHPFKIGSEMSKHKQHFKLWLSDLKYYRACNLFDSRVPPDYERLKAFA